MQILLFITMLLLMMSLATTTRFNLFMLSSGLRHAYTRYIQQDFFEFYNKKQKTKYDNASDKKSSAQKASVTTTKSSTKSSSRTPVKPSTEKKSVTRINVYPLFAPKPSQLPAALDYAANIKTLLIRFIEIHYTNQQPFKEAFTRMSVEDFVNEMIDGSRVPVCGRAVGERADLSSIPFHTRSMRELFYWMMVGGGIEERYPSLLDFFDWNLETPPISIYSAPEPLLFAIYKNNPHQVELIINSRQELHTLLNLSGTEVSDELRQEKAKTWSALFNMEILTGFPESFLDFTISTKEPGAG